MYWLCYLCDTFKISCPHLYYAVTDTKLDSTSHMHTKHISTHVAHICVLIVVHDRKPMHTLLFNMYDIRGLR